VTMNAVAEYDFEPEYQGEIALKAGDVLIVDSIGGRDGLADESWWHGTVVDRGESGWFPGTFCSINT
jgi:hypothetical protein